jgi:hypothetical protein
VLDRRTLSRLKVKTLKVVLSASSTAFLDLHEPGTLDRADKLNKDSIMPKVKQWDRHLEFL